jgi:hypothetical protein
MEQPDSRQHAVPMIMTQMSSAGPRTRAWKDHPVIEGIRYSGIRLLSIENQSGTRFAL